MLVEGTNDDVRIAKSPSLLFNHFFAVAFYSLWCLFTKPRRIHAPSSSGVVSKPVFAAPHFYEYPNLFIQSIRVFWTAVVVFGPLMWSELRWWSPTDTKRRNRVAFFAIFPIVFAVGFVMAVYYKTLAMQLEYFPPLQRVVEYNSSL
jgi:squalene monooxygenase